MVLTLQEDSLNWALSHALSYGDTDVFPRPFEYLALDHDRSNVVDYLAQQNVSEWIVRPHRTLIAPKARYSFRPVTQLDPLDFLVFSALIREIVEDLESRRISRSEQIVFSYRARCQSDGRLFDPSIGYTDFVSQTRSILDSDATVSFVGLADIADFYPRIYHHRLEAALEGATVRVNHVRALRNLLRGWNGTETFGIPVGSAPARMLAEVTISDVDEALLARGIRFLRFNDDYRIFAREHGEAYRALAFLGDILYRNHGLTLQPQKTRILSAEDGWDQLLHLPWNRELESLHERFDELISQLGLGNPYEPIDYDSLDDEHKQLIDSLNLAEIFREQLNTDREPDYNTVRFVLRRLSQLRDEELLDEVVANVHVLYPILPDVVRYLKGLTLTSDQRADVGRQILQLLEESVLSELEFHRMWVLDLFSESRDWNNEEQFLQLLAKSRGSVDRRKLVLAMARAGHRYWFQSQWRQLFDETPWVRRAVIAGCSCLPGDARRHWYRSVESRLDPLEIAVMRWARAHPFFT